MGFTPKSGMEILLEGFLKKHGLSVEVIKHNIEQATVNIPLVIADVHARVQAMHESQLRTEAKVDLLLKELGVKIPRMELTSGDNSSASKRTA